MAYEHGVSFRIVIMAKPQEGREGRVALRCGAERLNLTPKQVIENALPSFVVTSDVTIFTLMKSALLAKPTPSELRAHMTM